MEHFWNAVELILRTRDSKGLSVGIESFDTSFTEIVRSQVFCDLYSSLIEDMHTIRGDWKN